MPSICVHSEVGDILLQNYQSGGHHNESFQEEDAASASGVLQLEEARRGDPKTGAEGLSG